jgi:hypothetical protein
MVVLQTESMHRELAALLAMYRKSLVASKPRKRGSDPQEVLTRYYRVEERMADDLVKLLPEIVLPESWQHEQRPKATGTILKVTSGTDVTGGIRSDAVQQASANNAPKLPAAIIPRAVLIIRQTRAAHEEISKVIDRIEEGDPRMLPDGEGEGGVGGGKGLGGGGFGGGYFTVPSKKPSIK